MYVCLQAIFILGLFQSSSSFDLSSFFTSNSLTSIISQYLGPSNATSIFTNIIQSFDSRNRSFIMKTINASMEELENMGVIDGYSANRSIVKLGVLNVAALNASLNGKVTNDVINFVISKLKKSGYITGVHSVGNNYHDLGIINLSPLSNQTQPKIPYPTKDYYQDSGNGTYNKTLLMMNPYLIFLGPLVGVQNISKNATRSEKIAVYKQWYSATVTALKANNSNPTLADYRKAFFCYPGYTPLNTTNVTLSTTIVTCQELNSTYTTTIQETTDLFNLIKTPEAAAAFLTNASDLSSIKSIISNLRTRLGYLSTVLAETSLSAAVNSQVQLVRELIIALPQNTSNSSTLASFKDYMTKYFQWTPQDFTKLQSELSLKA